MFPTVVCSFSWKLINFPIFSKFLPNPAGATRFEARLQGYKGGEGIIEFAQIDGRATQTMVVISGLKENSVRQMIGLSLINW